MADNQRTLRVVVVGNADQAQRALRDLGDQAEDAGGQVDGMGSRFEGLKAGLAGMGAAVLAALPVAALVGFSKGLEQIGQEAKLAAQMGLSGEDAAAAGDLAGKLYAKGFGESVADTGEAVKRVSQDLNLAIDSVDFEPIASKVLTVTQTFDQDLGGVTRAVSQLMRTDLASSAEEALDIVAAGFTAGVDKSEDFLDTLNEYGTQFRNMGLTGAQATGLMTQGLQAGARDADTVADAIKEFSIEAVKGSDGIRDGFKRLGVDADDMFDAIRKGGPDAAGALDLTLDELRKIEDPIKRNSVAFDLFGTKSEDLGDALYALDPSKAVDSLGEVEGAATRMGDTLQNNAAAKVERFKRRLEVGFTDMFAGLITSAESASSRLGPIFDGAGQALGPVADQVKAAFGPAVTQTIENGSRLFGVLRTAAGTLVPLFTSIGATVLPVLRTIVSVVTGTMVPALLGLADTVMPHFRNFVGFLQTQVVPILQGMFEKAQPVLQQFGSVFKSVMEAIGVAVNVLAPILQMLWKFIGPVVVTTLQGLWDGIVGVIRGALNIIQGIAEVFIGVFTGDWSRAWEGVKQIFSGIWDAIVGAIKVYLYGTIVGILRGGVAKLLSLWRSGWNGIKSAFTAVVNFIKGGVTGWVNGIRSTISGGVEAVKRLWSNGWSGLKRTVTDTARGIGDVVKGIPGNIKSFFKNLPKDLLQIGKDVVQGLVNGLKSGLDKVLAAAGALVDKIPGPIRKALGINSPSKVMAEIGKWITEGLVKGMLGGTAKVAETSKNLQAKIQQAFTVGKISKSTRTSLVGYVAAQNKRLDALSKSRSSIVAQITAANTQLANLQVAKGEYASSIAGRGAESATLMGVLDTSEYGDNSASSIIARLRSRVSAIADFRKNLSTLASRGLGRELIDEIAQAGPEQGGQMAQALLNADLGQIRELNSVYASVGTESSKLGDVAASSFYDAGIDATKGLIKGLVSQQTAVAKSIAAIADTMVSTLKKKLGIRSPSRVFRTQGRFTGQGFALGVEDEQAAVQAAVDGLAGTRPTGRLANRSIARETAYRAASSAAVAPVVHVTVQGHVTTEKALARSIATTVRDEIVRNGKRNGGRTGL